MTFGTLTETLIHHILTNGIQFDKTSVYKRSENHPMVYLKNWETYRDYIVEVFYENKVYYNNSSSFEQMISVLEKRKFKEIRYIQHNLKWVAFRNGAFNIEAAVFIPLAEIERGTEIIAHRYLDTEFETALVSSLVKVQDPIQRFVHDVNQRNVELFDYLNEGYISASNLYSVYQHWSKECGEEAKTGTFFGREIKRFLKYKRITSGTKYNLVL